MSAEPSPSPDPTSAATSSRTITTIALWVLQVALAAYMLWYAAIPRLFALGTSVEMFEDIGLGQWFRYVVGGLELLAAIGLVIPRVAGAAALGLVGLMIGATFTNLFVINGGPWTFVTIGITVLSALIAWGRRAEIAALLSLLRR